MGGASMTDESPFQDRMRRASDGVVLTLIAKVAAAIVLPAIAFLAGGLYIKLDRTAESAARLEEKVSALISSTLPQLNIQLDGRFNSLSDRVTAHDRRLDRLEDWRNTSPPRIAPN